MKFKNMMKIIKRPSLWFPDGKYNKKVDDLVKDMIRNRDKIVLLDCSQCGIWFIYNQKVYWFHGHYFVTESKIGTTTLLESTLKLFPNSLNIRFQQQAHDLLYRDLRPSRLTMLRFFNKIYLPAQRVLNYFGFRKVERDEEFYENGKKEMRVPTDVVFNLSYSMAQVKVEDGKVFHYLFQDRTELK